MMPQDVLTYDSQDADGRRIEESFRPAQGEIGKPIRLVVYYDSCSKFDSCHFH